MKPLILFSSSSDSSNSSHSNEENHTINYTQQTKSTDNDSYNSDLISFSPIKQQNSSKSIQKVGNESFSPKINSTHMQNQLNNQEKENDIIIDNNSEDEDIPLIIFSKQQSFKFATPITYAIARKIKQKIRGKRYYYYLYSNSKIKYCSKTKSRHPSHHITIHKGNKIRSNAKSKYHLQIENHCTKFSLKNQHNEDLLCLTINIDSTILKLPRIISIQINQALGVPSFSLTTKTPGVSSRGDFILDFHNKFTLPSEKNNIFVPSNDIDGPYLLVTRKISTNDIEIDVNIELPEFAVYAIGLGIFIAKLH